MSAKPYMTTDDLVDAVARKISLPIYQSTFSKSDIRKFLNEEMSISMVPQVLQFHEEYYVVRVDVPLKPNVSSYPIPDRAIGMRMRDIMFVDQGGNLYELSRVDADDKVFFQSSSTSGGRTISKFYLEGNNVVLLPKISSITSGSLAFFIYIRPNQLVSNDRAAFIKSFQQKITINNSNLQNGDTIKIKNIVFTAVSGTPANNTEFQIGTSSVITATNLVNSINSIGEFFASNDNPATNIVTVSLSELDDIKKITSSNLNGMNFSNNFIYLEFNSLSSNYVDNETNISEDLFIEGKKIDFLQTNPGHSILKFDVKIQPNSISGDTIKFPINDVPDNLSVGDYICLAHECIIPYLPPDMHTSLAEKAAARILAALGDIQGLQIVNDKLREMELRQGTLLDNRTEGAPRKILPRHSIFRYLKVGSRIKF